MLGVSQHVASWEPSTGREPGVGYTGFGDGATLLRLTRDGVGLSAGHLEKRSPPGGAGTGRVL